MNTTIVEVDKKEDRYLDVNYTVDATVDVHKDGSLIKNNYGVKDHHVVGVENNVLVILFEKEEVTYFVYNSEVSLGFIMTKADVTRVVIFI